MLLRPAYVNDLADPASRISDAPFQVHLLTTCANHAVAGPSPLDSGKVLIAGCIDVDAGYGRTGVRILWDGF